jgi:hypothetical protein
MARTRWGARHGFALARPAGRTPLARFTSAATLAGSAAAAAAVLAVGIDEGAWPTAPAIVALGAVELALGGLVVLHVGRVEAAHLDALARLEAALGDVRQLSGLLPMCAAALRPGRRF